MFLNREYDQSRFPLGPRDAVRLRPGMYVGGTDTNALHHLIYQVMDHFVEEAFVGKCNSIVLTLHDGGIVSIGGNGEGLPIDKYKDTPFTKMEALMLGLDVTKRDFEPDVYRVTGGLHGLGLSVINVLCTEMIIENIKDGYLWRQTFHEGVPQAAVEQLDITDQQQGTKLTFKPDFTIFEAVPFDRDRLIKRCREIAYQIANLKVLFRDERDSSPYEETFLSHDGLRSMVVSLNSTYEALHEPIYIHRNVIIHKDGSPDDLVGIELAFQFTKGNETNIFSYVNTVRTTDGGTHLSALTNAILATLNNYIEYWYGWNEEVDALSWKDIALGLSAVISIRLSEPRFESPTKVRIGNPEIYGPISGLVFEAFSPQHAAIKRIIEYHLTRKTHQ